MFLVSQSQIPPNFHCIFNKMEKNMLTEVLGEVGSREGSRQESYLTGEAFGVEPGLYSPKSWVYVVGNNIT